MSIRLEKCSECGAGVLHFFDKCPHCGKEKTLTKNQDRETIVTDEKKKTYPPSLLGGSDSSY